MKSVHFAVQKLQCTRLRRMASAASPSWVSRTKSARRVCIQIPLYIRPGLKMPAGSNAALMRPWRARTAGVRG